MEGENNNIDLIPDSNQSFRQSQSVFDWDKFSNKQTLHMLLKGTKNRLKRNKNRPLVLFHCHGLYQYCILQIDYWLVREYRTLYYNHELPEWFPRGPNNVCPGLYTMKHMLVIISIMKCPLSLSVHLTITCGDKIQGDKQ